MTLLWVGSLLHYSFSQSGIGWTTTNLLATHACTYVHSPLQVPLSLALNLSLTQDSLDQTLDYSHHNTASMTPAGATVGDEADNSRAKVSPVVMRMHIHTYCST